MKKNPLLKQLFNRDDPTAGATATVRAGVRLAGGRVVLSAPLTMDLDSGGRGLGPTSPTVSPTV